MGFVVPLGCGKGQEGSSAAPPPRVLPPSLEPCGHILQGMAGAPSLAHGGGTRTYVRHAARREGHALGMAMGELGGVKNPGGVLEGLREI